MKYYTLEKDVKLYTVTAATFPEGVKAAFEILHSLINAGDTIGYYGISHANASGGITYKAAIAIKETTSAVPLLETYTLHAGKYRGREILNFRDCISDIGKTFQELIQDPDIDKNGCCIEEYYNDTDVRCMVKIGDIVA